MTHKANCSAPIYNRKYQHFRSLPVIRASDFLSCNFLSSGDIWPYLETLLVVTTGAEECPSILWAEARAAADGPHNAYG